MYYTKFMSIFSKDKRARNKDGTFKKDVWWNPWSDAWE